MYYQHLKEIEKSCNRYIDSLNHIAQIMPTSCSTDIITAYDRVISSWQLLVSINDECRLNISALPDVANEERRMEGALKSSQQAFGAQLKTYIWFTLCLCITVLTGIGSNVTRLLVIAVGSVYFIIRSVLFVCATTRILTKETEDLILWMQFKQEIDNIHHDLIGFTELVHDTIECVKSMWVEKRQQWLEVM
ncbi:Homeobox protein tos8 [Mucor velutinosus]|uniref:Homeobox protein tos8 n=1 Tax=Mucor velutinosus TaxID=708070 RepID=A0AAN7DFW2_9FUNG|nr:Homeobox protein tos8 [Mucor velutinosus]